MKEIFKSDSKQIMIIFMLILWVTAGCEDFLDKPLQGKLTQEVFPTTSEDAELATNAIYNILREGNFHSGLFPILDIMSDDAYKGSNPDDAASTIGPYDRFQHISTEGSLGRWWNTVYQGIKRANVVIEYIPDIDMDAELQNRLIGEAKFLRALFYFDLVRAWGGVPIVTSVNPPTDLGRAPKEDVFSLIEMDLLDAIEALPEKSDMNEASLGRATRGAAKSLLARVYLFLGDYPEVEKYALEVINSQEYGLEPVFNDASSVNGEHGIESVFEIGAIGEKEGLENGGNFYANVQGVRGTPNRGWGFNRPSLDLMKAFENGDPRKDATIIYLGEVLDGVTIKGDGTTPDITIVNGDTLEIECYNQKVWTPGVIVAPTQGHNRRWIRYSDVLLMAAEALNENGKQVEARIYLNQVRERAREGNDAILPDVIENDKDALRDIILHERRVELALEGHRFWDLIRTGNAKTVLGPLGFVEGKHELLAIPQTEIDISQGKLEQNPNWE